MNMHAPIASIGHNNPPLSAFEAHQANINDLYVEAKNWLDGEPIANAEQAAKVELLLDMVRTAHDAADEDRIEENKPFDEGKAEVQKRYAPLISDTKAIKGKTILAATACKAALGPWRQKVEDERRAAAERLQAIADEQDRLAREALQAAPQDDLTAREEAEALVTAAHDAKAVAQRAGRAASTGTGLRSHWMPALTDGVAAARHYWAERRPEYEAFLLSLARSDVASGKRQIPGFNVIEERRAV